MEESFSLWIIPPSEVADLLQKIISDLSNKYKSPSFEPHMTLLGNISLNKKSVIQQATTLASKLKPFPISLSEVSFSTTYFQSVLVRVKATAPLMNANLTAKKIYQSENNVFMPHISLLYGNHAMDEREKIASEIVLPDNVTFIADKIIVTPSTPNPNEWKHIAEFNFH